MKSIAPLWIQLPEHVSMLQLGLGKLLQGIGARKHCNEIKQIQCDNQGAITLTRNPEYPARTKYIDIHFNFIHQHVKSALIELLYCPTYEMTADIFTKPLPYPQFEKNVPRLELNQSPRPGNDKLWKLKLDETHSQW